MPAQIRRKTAPSVDSSLGLVLRLNNLWAMADAKHLAGELLEWNSYLNVIYDNLSYDADVKVVKDNNGNIVNLKFVADHEAIFLMYARRLDEARKQYYLAMRRRSKADLIKTQNKIYACLVDKSRWLRTFEHKLGLYLREVPVSEGGSIWGTG